MKIKDLSLFCRVSVALLALLAGVSFNGVVEAGNDNFYEWQRLVERGQGLEIENKLVTVNAFFNNMRSISDKELWQQQDYWALPQEMLAKGAGDCEDFALAKFHTLMALGVPEERLRLINGRLFNLSRTGIEAHMVLAYFPEKGEPLILDNVEQRLVKQSKRHDFVAKFAFNQQGVWRFRGKRWLGEGLVNHYQKWQRYTRRLALSNYDQLAAGKLPARDS